MNLLGFGKFFEKFDSNEYGNNKTFETTRRTCDWLTKKVSLFATAAGGTLMVVLAGIGFVAPKDNNNGRGHGNNNQRPHYRDRR